jgi:exonuclease III
MILGLFRASRAFLLIVLSLSAADPLSSAEPERLRIMTFNIWVGGEAGRQPLSQTIEVIESAKADLVGLQETRGERQNGRRPDAARAIANELGWQYLDQDDGTGIISRFKIAGHTPKKWGASIELPSGRRVWHFNAHFAHAPYQPYQLLKIPYADAPFISGAGAAVAAARQARQKQVSAMLAELQGVDDDHVAAFVTGDFNEPSPLDWTNDVFAAGRCPVAVKWPTASAVLEAGFVDAYRQTHADPLEHPGHTWTPITAKDDPSDRHDRIDFVLVGGREATIEKCEIIGEASKYADIVVAPYPSDHRAVVASISLE